MLIDFAVKNFRSIKERQVFSMEPATKVKEMPENLGTVGKDKLLKSAVVYGRNASGKSNLLMAMDTLQKLVKKSADIKVGENSPYYMPYLLDKSTMNAPTEFEISFYAKNGLRYNYKIIYNQTDILKEELYFYISQKPTKLYIREKDKPIDAGEQLDKHYQDIENTLYPNQLFLSKIGTQKVEALEPVYSFFNAKLLIYTSHDTRMDENITKAFSLLVKHKEYAFLEDNINILLKAFDTGIQNVHIHGKEINESLPIPEMIKENIKIKTIHKIYERENVVDEIDFDLSLESEGTKKLFALGGRFILSIWNGAVCVVDELDKSLHPQLTRAIIKLFNNAETNPRNAQLIFATHDTSLLDSELFRRDQIWFAEKDVKGESTFYSLSDIKGVRKGVPYDKWYMDGRFGAVPVINEHKLKFKFE